MKDAHAIYYYLFWDVSIETLNNKVDEARRNKDQGKVEFLCKVIALKSMGMTAEGFWLTHLNDLRTEYLLMQDATNNY